MKIASLLFVAVALLAMTACSKSRPEDPLCSIGPLPETTRLKAGQGGLQIMSAAQDHFYAVDAAGKQVGYARTGEALGVAPGEYKAKLNNSLHSVSVEKGSLTRCSTGMLLVKGSTDEHYYVLDEVGTQLAYARLGGATALFPGRYVVKVNNTRANVDIKQDATTDVQAGLVVVQGDTDAHFYVLDSAGTQLAYSKLAKPVALLPGTYTSKVNNTTAPVTVQAGATATIATGTVLAQGSADQHYYILDGAGTQLSYAKLGQGLSFVPGNYTLKVNGSTASVKVEPGKRTEYPAAILTVNGSASGHYYVLDPNGTQLSYSKLNEPLALAAGSYSVKVGESAKPVTLAAGESKTMSW